MLYYRFVYSFWTSHLLFWSPLIFKICHKPKSLLRIFYHYSRSTKIKKKLSFGIIFRKVEVSISLFIDPDVYSFQSGPSIKQHQETFWLHRTWFLSTQESVSISQNFQVFKSKTCFAHLFVSLMINESISS